ncbi:MAG: phosphotransferase [Ilumatobacteraceae bacterium]
MTGDEITAEWLGSILGGTVGRLTHQRIGDGHIGVNVRVGIGEHDPGLPDSVVIKLPATDETSLSTAAMLRHYEREVRFYQEIAPTVDMRVPACFHADWTPETNDFVLVLEDMAPAEQGDQLTGCTLEQAYVAVRELAKLHGPRWDDPTLFDVAWMEHGGGAEAGMQLAMMWQMFFPGFAATYASHLAPDEMELAEQFGARIVDWRSGRAASPRAVTHGDYRLDNMLFQTPQGGPPVTVVDWQTPGHGEPIADLSYFCGAGLLPPERREHERSLVAAYTEALGEYSIELDDDWVWEQYRRETFAGLTVAAMASQIVTLNDRSEAMFGAMASRHLRHALDLDSMSTF